MDDPARKPSDTPPLHSTESGLFGALFGFHKNVMDLLRAAKLDDDKLDIAAERIKLLMDKVGDEIERTRDLNVQGRLDSMYEELKRLVEELSKSSKKDGPDSA